MEKKCAKCGIIKKISEYSKLSRSSDGFHYRCKSCCNEYYKSLYPKIRERKIDSAKSRYSLNKESIIQKAKSRYDSNKKRIYNKQYNVANRLKINSYKNQYEKKKVLNDPNYRLIKIMRKSLYRLVKNKKEPTFSIVGYSKETLIKWLGRCPNLNEAIDHKIPVSWFLNDAPISIISHYKNLQILDKSDNSKKSNSYSDIIDFDFYEMAINYIKEKYKPKVKHYGK